MATVTDDVDEIRRNMAQIRQRLHQDMQGVVAGAEAASDWKHYVRLYPFAALGLAFVGGFLIVPRRRRSVSKTARKAAEAVLAEVGEKAEAASESIKPKAAEPKKKGLIGGAFALLSPFLLKAAQNYAMAYVESWIAQQQQAQQSAGPPGFGVPGGFAGPGMPPQQGGPRPGGSRPR